MCTSPKKEFSGYFRSLITLTTQWIDFTMQEAVPQG